MVNHGTRNSYNNYCCRCDECREAQAIYMRGFRAKYRPAYTLDHGKNSTYVNYRCRCEDCKSSHRAYLRGGAGDLTEGVY